MKKLLVVLAAVPLLLSLFACQGGPKPIDTSYETPDGKKVAVRQVEPLSEAQTAEVGWVNTSEENIFENVDIAAKGRVSNIREIEMTYKYPGEEIMLTDHAAIFDFTFEEIYRSDADPGKKITVFTGICSYFTPVEQEDSEYEIRPLEEGKSYFLHLRSLANREDNSLELERIADYMITYPQSFLIPADSEEEYLIRKFKVYTSEINSNETVERYASRDTISANDFAEFLKEYFK